MTGLADRLARISVEELRFRSRETAFVALETLQYCCGASTPKRTGLVRGLRNSPPLADIRGALLSRDWRAANAALRRHFLERSRFVISPGSRATLVSRILGRLPHAQADATGRAGRLLQGRYDLLGYCGLSFSRGPHELDWHFDPVHRKTAPRRFWSRVPYLDPQCGDHKIIWELNRHQHWLILGRAAWLNGDPTYARAFTRQLRSWIAANPPLVGINWASMLELALRSLSWLWAVHFFAWFEEEDESGWLIDLLSNLSFHLDHVSRHLSRYFSPNTHLLGEGLALYVAGRVLPELNAASRWQNAGRHVLIEGATSQVNRDGGHAELSTHYHRYALDFYLLALCIARRTGDPTAQLFQQVVERLASYCRVVADDSGRLPTIGDDDGGMLFPICGRPPADVRDSLWLAAILLQRPDLTIGVPPEEVFWMLDGEVPPAPRPAAARPASRVFPDTGYAVFRSATDHAILDVGRHGFLNGGHAHSDALSLVLTVAGRPLAIDPGTATYTMNRSVRDRFRSTAMHNTVVVDGRQQSVPSGSFHWLTRVDARPALWHQDQGFGHVEAEHQAYAPLVHRRALTMADDGLWIVADHIVGRGTHTADVYWHLADGWSRASHGSGTLAHNEGDRAAIVSTAGEPAEFFADGGGLGWFAPVYGRILPALTLRFSARSEAPFTVLTAIAGTRSPEGLEITAISPIAEHRDGRHRAAARITHGDSTIVAILATPVGDSDVQQTRASQRIVADAGEFSTDARVAIIRLARSGEPVSLHLLDATHASWFGRYDLVIPAMSPAQDLHFDQDALCRLSRCVEARPAGPLCGS